MIARPLHWDTLLTAANIRYRINWYVIALTGYVTKDLHKQARQGGTTMAVRDSRVEDTLYPDDLVDYDAKRNGFKQSGFARLSQAL